MTQSNAERNVAEHVAFGVDRGWVHDVQRVFAHPSTETASQVLERWWAVWRQRLDVAVVPFGASQHQALSRALLTEPDLHALLPPVQSSVRLVALTLLERVAPRLAALRALNAPPVVVDGQLRNCAAQLRALDPRAAWPSPHVPTTGTLSDSAAGEEVPDLHAWLGHMLSAAHADQPNVGLGLAFDATPEAKQYHSGPRVELSTPSVWPGFEYAVMSVKPDPAFWCSPRVTLPHLLCARGSNGEPCWVVAESSGLVSFALAVDRDSLSLQLEPSLSAAITVLPEDDALVSFVWLATPASGPWRPY